METTLFVLFNGAAYGLLLFLLSSGFTLVFGIMGVLNVAHASFFMLGAYFAYQIGLAGGFWLGLLLAPLLVALVGGVIERHLLTRVRIQGHTAELLVTFGLSYVMTEAVQLVWGRLPVPYEVPASLNMPLFSLGGLQYSAYRVLSFGLTTIIFVVLAVTSRYSIAGAIIQAALTHPTMTASLGHDVPKVFNRVFAVGAGLAGLGGALAGNVLGTQPTMALQLGALIFVVVVVGGMGSVVGAFVASMVIGMLQTLAVSYPISLQGLLASVGVAFGGVTWIPELVTISSASAAPLLPYFLMILVLLARPRGLFGRRDA